MYEEPGLDKIRNVFTVWDAEEEVEWWWQPTLFVQVPKDYQVVLGCCYSKLQDDDSMTKLEFGIVSVRLQVDCEGFSEEFDGVVSEIFSVFLKIRIEVGRKNEQYRW